MKDRVEILIDPATRLDLDRFLISFFLAKWQELGQGGRWQACGMPGLRGVLQRTWLLLVRRRTPWTGRWGKWVVMHPGPCGGASERLHVHEKSGSSSLA